MRRTTQKIILLLLAAGITQVGTCQQVSKGDQEALRFILEKKSKESDVIIPLSTYWTLEPIFSPKDLAELLPGGIRTDHFVQNGLGAFMVIEGTGRVYQLNKDLQDGLRFDRLDSSRHFGYNYGALIFSFRDTLYSMGGYGFWQNNGHLRRFDLGRHTWEIVPTNRRVQARQVQLGYFVDRINNTLWYGNLFNKFEELKPSELVDEVKEEGAVFRLDLNSKNWNVAGRMTPEFRKLYSEYQIFAQTPWGSLIFGGNQDQHLYLIGYSSNQLLEFKDKKLGKEIGNMSVGREGMTGLGRPLFWFNQDSLHVYITGVGHSSHHLSLNQFIESGIEIYTPESKQTSIHLSDVWLMIFLFGTGVVFGSAAGYGFFKYRQTKPLPQEPEYFAEQERKILLALDAASGSTMSVEEMDMLLKTEKKSKDRQNQVRSSVTRSINQKYNLLTGDPENLIETRRQEFDRRMIRYELNQTKFAAIRNQVTNNA